MWNIFKKKAIRDGFIVICPYCKSYSLDIINNDTFKCKDCKKESK